MRNYSIVAVALVISVVLGATVFREPIAWAAQSVEARIVGPLDGQGNVKVQEQGTPTVKIDPSSNTVQLASGASVAVTGSGDSPLPVMNIAGTPYAESISCPGLPPVCGFSALPAGKRLVVESVSMFHAANPGALNARAAFNFQLSGQQPHTFHIVIEKMGSVGIPCCADYYSASLQLRAYTDVAPTCEAYAYGTLHCTVVGYLVDAL